MVDTDNFLSNMGFSTVRQLVGVGRSIVVIPVITKLAGADIYGFWTTIMALVGVIATIGGFHLHGALIRYSQREDETKTLVNTLTLASCVAAILIAVAILLDIVVQKPPLFASLESRGPLFITTVGVLSAATIVFNILHAAPRALNNIKVYEIISIGKKASDILVLGVVFLTVKDILVALWGLIGAFVVLIVILLVYSLRGRLARPDPKQFRRYFSYGIPMIPKEMAGSMLTHADKFLILYFISPAATGAYAVCYGLAKMLNNFSSVINPTLYPTISAAWDNGEFDQISSLYHNIFRGYFLLGVPAAAGLTILSYPVVRLLSTEAIAERADLLVPVLALGFLFYGMEFSLSYVLTAAEETHRIGVANVVVAVLNVFLNLALLPTIGLIGAAVATVFSQMCLFGYLYTRANTLVPLSFPLTDVGRALLSTAVMSGVLLGMPLSRMNVLSVAVFPLVGAAVYAIVLFVTGGVSRREVEQALAIVR